MVNAKFLVSAALVYYTQTKNLISLRLTDRPAGKRTENLFDLLKAKPIVPGHVTLKRLVRYGAAEIWCRRRFYSRTLVQKEFTAGLKCSSNIVYDSS